MTIRAAIGRIGATAVAMVHTRLELAAVEMQEEAKRFAGYLVSMLMATFLLACSVLLAALFVIVLFWDSYRLLAVGGMAALFALAGVVLMMKVRASFESRPPMLSATLAELRNDVEFATGGTGAAHD
jgi:uncharacterized membrane protein YqjE